MEKTTPALKPRRPRKRPQARQGPGRLRRNVGVVITDGKGKVLAGLRAHANGSKAWQLPQGGIERGERPLQAAYRELEEETGITREDVKLIAERGRWTQYWLPKEWVAGRRFAGQTQKWYLFIYTAKQAPDVAKASDHEFEALDWVDPTWLQQHVIDFRKPVYDKVFSAFNKHLGGGYAPADEENV